jgi:hypothetical protein
MSYQPAKILIRHSAEAREAAIRIHCLWLWIPDSLASLGFRNDEMGIGIRNAQ